MNDMRKVWDTAADTYDEYFTTAQGVEIFRIELRTLRCILKPKTEGRVLDVGCGTGLFTVNVFGDSFELVGVDTSVKMATLARGRGVNVIVSDAHHLPFRNEVFDTVMFFTSLEFLGEDDALKEAHRVLNNKGSILVGVHNLLNPWNVYRKFRAHLKKRSFYKTIRYYSPWRLSRGLRCKRFRPGALSSCALLPCLLKTSPCAAASRVLEGRFVFRHLGAILVLSGAKSQKGSD
ncbi:MAG: class I SAM-dependent methyltransferase [Candidatus Freyarchaeota archaeon]